MTDVSDITAKIATARVLRHYRSAIDSHTDKITMQSARVAAQLAQESADSFERLNLPRSNNLGILSAAAAAAPRHPFEVAAAATNTNTAATATDGALVEASPLEVNAYGMFWSAMEQACLSPDPSNHDPTSSSSGGTFEHRKAAHLGFRRSAPASADVRANNGLDATDAANTNAGSAAVAPTAASVAAAAHDASAHAVEVAEASFESGPDQALALWHATSGATSDALLLKATLNRLDRLRKELELSESKKKSEEEEKASKKSIPPRRKSSHSATAAAAAAAAREEVAAKKRLSKSGAASATNETNNAASGAAAALEQQQLHKPSVWKRAEDDEGLEEKPMSEKRAELVRMLSV